MIVGFEDRELGAGAPLRELAAARYPLLARLSGHWARTVPASAAACAGALLRRGVSPETPARVFIVPGRIEVLGKHTDYAGGRSLIGAVERGLTLVAADRTDATIGVHALDAGESAEFPFAPDLDPPAGWINYPMTVARRLARNFPGLSAGAEIAFRSDLPAASGMSSSSALMIGTFLGIAAAGGVFDDHRFRRNIDGLDDLAAYLAAVESGQGFGELRGDRGVGTHGGSEDHTAILQGREGVLLQYRFVPAVLERTIELPAGYRFAIASSGVAAEKTGAMRERYNRASALVRTLRELWDRSGGEPAPSLAAAIRSSSDALARLQGELDRPERLGYPPRELRNRLEHFVRESEEIVPAAASALAERQLDRFGELVDESQRLATELLDNQIPETSELARSARRLGAVAASAFGAGYGGSVWALVEERRADEFLRSWRAAYLQAFPARADAAFFTSAAGPAAARVA